MLPGVILFVNVEGLRRMSAMNATVIPPELEERLDRVDGDAPAVRRLAVEVSAAMPLILSRLCEIASILRSWIGEAA